MSAPPDALVCSSGVCAGGGASATRHPCFFLSSVFEGRGACLHHPTLSFVHLAFVHPTPDSCYFGHLKYKSKFSSHCRDLCCNRFITLHSRFSFSHFLWSLLLMLFL